MANAMFELSIGRMLSDEPRLEAGDIGGCVEQAVYEIMPSADARDIEVTVHTTPPAAPMLFDASQIEQVLANLLDNACKFTPIQGTIEVRGYPVSWPFRPFRVPGGDGYFHVSHPTGEGPNGYRVDVHDSGPGIPPECLGRIFQQTVSYAGSQDRSGTGLGLATCRMIMAAHHGEVFAESRGEGATFSLVLPFIRREAADELLRDGGGDPLLASAST
jgi:signal transduction histidine kinase